MIGIDEIEADGGVADEDFAGAGLGDRPLGDLKNLGPALGDGFDDEPQSSAALRCASVRCSASSASDAS